MNKAKGNLVKTLLSTCRATVMLVNDCSVFDQCISYSIHFVNNLS